MAHFDAKALFLRLIMAPAFAKAHSKVNNMVGFTGSDTTGIGGGVSESKYRIDIVVNGTIGPVSYTHLTLPTKA